MTRRDSSALVWGLIFGCVAALGLWVGTGHTVNWATFTIAAPLVLIAIGALGLLLGRSRPKNRSRKEPR